MNRERIFEIIDEEYGDSWNCSILTSEFIPQLKKRLKKEFASSQKSEVKEE